MLEKESKGKEEKMNKIKAVAVKAKKELDNSRKEVRQPLHLVMYYIIILFCMFNIHIHINLLTNLC